MPKLRTAQQAYSRGVNRDIAREAVPENGAWNLQDFIPDRLDAPLRKRGGWHPVTGLAPGAGVSAMTGGVYAPFSAGARVVFLDSGGALRHAVAPHNSWANVAAVATSQNPIFHRDLVIVSPRVLTSKLKKFDGATVADLHASAPQARYATVYRDRVVAGLLIGAQNRIQWGPDGNPAAVWDTTYAWVDSSLPVRGLFGMRNSLLVFHDNSIERILGSIPPGTANFDMRLDGLFDGIGLLDARSITPYQDNVIWADRSGVYMTDGAIPIDLTKAGGISDFWRARVAGFGQDETGVGWACASAVYAGLLMVTLTNAAGGFVECFVCDVATRTWFRFQNFPFTTLFATPDDAYAGRSDAHGAASLASILGPSFVFKNDGNGLPVLPVLETGYLRAPDLARWYEMHFGYDLRDSGSDNPALRVHYSFEPEGESYLTIPTDLTETTGYRERRLPIRGVAPGVALKIEQVNASADTRLYGIKARVEALEGGRQYG